MREAVPAESWRVTFVFIFDSHWTQIFQAQCLGARAVSGTVSGEGLGRPLFDDCRARKRIIAEHALGVIEGDSGGRFT